jgi:hypothetical protein
MSKRVTVTFRAIGVPVGEELIIGGVGPQVTGVNTTNGISVKMGSPASGVQAIVPDAQAGQAVASVIAAALVVMGLTPVAADQIASNGARTELTPA